MFPGVLAAMAHADGSMQRDVQERFSRERMKPLLDRFTRNAAEAMEQALRSWRDGDEDGTHIALDKALTWRMAAEDVYAAMPGATRDDLPTDVG